MWTYGVRMNLDDLPADYADALTALFTNRPWERALEDLVVRCEPDREAAALVEQAVGELGVGDSSPIAAGLWMYIDDLERSHTVSQSIPDATGSYWHGIMHRREGDFGNSHYWFRRVGAHPAMEKIAGYDPHAFIDAVAERGPDSVDDLVDLQRREFWALFRWCAWND